MRQAIKFTVLAIMSLCILSFFQACGDDEPESNTSELIGYWYWEEDGEFEAMNIMDGGAGEYIYGICNKPESIYSDYFTWDDNHVQGVKVVSVTSDTLIQQEGSEVIVYKRISAKQWSNLKSKASLDGSNPDTPNRPDTPDEPTLTSSDFEGIWLHPSSAYVFELQSSGIGYMYVLKSWKGDEYTEKVSAAWEYKTSSSQLEISTFKGRFEETVTKTDFPYSFSTTEGKWEKQSKLPTPYNPGNQEGSSQLAGTNWSGTVDGDYVELSFRKDGTFTEIYAGDRSTSTYTELDNNTIIIGEGTVMYNTFGENPFHFELSANKSTLTFYNDYETWKFKRKA